MLNTKNMSEKELMNHVYECQDKILRILRSRPVIVNNSSLNYDASDLIAAYLISKAEKYNDPTTVTFSEVLKDVDETLAYLANEYKLGDLWTSLLELTKEYPAYFFSGLAKARILTEPMMTPVSIADIAEEVLNIQENDSFADFCSGTGIVALSVKENNPKADVTAIELNKEPLAIARMYAELDEKGITFENKDVFDVALSNDNKKYSKIFANFPLGVRIKDLGAGKKYLENVVQRIPAITKATSADWLFNMLVVDSLTEDGKAVAIVTNGSTWNGIDASIRKYFIENGLVESVIALPNKVFYGIGMGTSLIVFSHGNKEVRLVDATKLFEPGRRISEMNEQHVEAVLKALNEDTDISMVVPLDELRNNEYVLHCSRYLANDEKVKGGIKFENVIKRITRGAPLNAEELDKLSSSVPTDVQYLMLANVKNGMIDTELPYLKMLDPKNERYCLTDHCLIMSKNGFPYKVAVAELNPGQKIMANGNLYIVELDEEKVSPYYLAAFFGSEKGIAALRSITGGATIPNIAVEKLRNLVIPIPSLEEQQNIVEEYRMLKDEMALLQLKLENVKTKMDHIFDEEV